MLAVRAGSVRMLRIPGLMLIKAGQVPCIKVFGQTVAIFDTRAEYLPFHPDRPDAPGFRIGPWYVAFNRGRRVMAP